MSSSAFAIGKVLRNASMIAARNAAIDTAMHRGMNDAKTPRINPATGRTLRGMGFLDSGDYFVDYGYGYDENGYYLYDPYYYGGDNVGGYDPYYDSYDWRDEYYFGFDPYAPVNPPDWQGNTDVFNWNWDENTSYWDEQNQGWWDMSDPTEYIFTDSDGQRYLVDAMTGDWETIHSLEPTYDIDPGDLQTTLDWWGSITGDTNADAVVLPDPDTIDWDYVGQLPGLGTSLPTFDLPSRIGPPPPKTASKNTKAEWLKKVQAALNAAKKATTSGGGGSGSPSGARPQTTNPNAQGQCPSGYAKNPNTGQCQLIPKQSVATDLQGLFTNPWFLLAAAGVVAIIAKK